ncbi:MAG: hypothetical protein Q8R15_01865 [Candidatus Micrarchaeota archaeon]|nr:hypothetical protein [Candidatus Micrarchaeota archaeon]
MDGEEEFVQVTDEFRDISTKLKDPILVGALLHRLTQERESTNLLLREINAKLDKIDQLESKIAQLENRTATVQNGTNQNQQPPLLAEVDQEIVAFVKKKSAVCAEDVQTKFKYKGKNAASSRLNKLCALGVVKKTQVGKKVFFQPVK